MGASEELTKAKEAKQLLISIANILNEVKSSIAIHNRKIKELSALLLRCGNNSHFQAALSRCITPLLLAQRRTACTERVVRFVSAFACSSPQSFLHEFLRYLLFASAACKKTVRFRACQFLSEIIMRLPDEAEVDNELWDDVIEGLKLRIGDRVSLIRIFSVRALSRFVADAENSDILDLFLQVLQEEENAEVRKTIVLALPPSNAALMSIVDCTLDVSEAVRKAAYCVLARKFPLPSLSIKDRTTILSRGLADRSEAVSKECLKLMIDDWLPKFCNDDIVKLLKYLDVETYESVGERVMSALLQVRTITSRDIHTIQNHIFPANNPSEGEHGSSIMDPEIAFYWRTICTHLQKQATVKGCDAASTRGAEAAVYAAEATDHNDLLESILPPTTSDFIALLQHHIDAGPNCYFSSRQLLLICSILDFSDFASHKEASNFARKLLLKPVNHEVEENGNKVVIGDGINLGGDKNWADAVSLLLQKIHSSNGQFEEILLQVIEELARPCRERAADFIQWIHCLSVAALFLQHANACHWRLQKSLDPINLLPSILLPGVKHSHLEVRRVAVRCLGLFGLKEKLPNDEVVKQLMDSFLNGAPPVTIMACKALFDLCMWHGVTAIDKALESDSNTDLLRLLYSYFARQEEEHETVLTVLAEGFSKLLLLGERYQDIPPALYPSILSKLITLYFTNDSKDLERAKQCLSVFFEHYPAVSPNHKKWLSKAFISVMHEMWPGISGNAERSSVWISNMRKLAVQASRFMLQMMQCPLYANDSDTDLSNHFSFECTEDGLALRIAAEVISFPVKKSSAEKAYIVTLCTILASLHVRTKEQTVVKLLKLLVRRIMETVPTESNVTRQLGRLVGHLMSVDSQPDEEISRIEVNAILEKLEINLDLDAILASVPQTPVVPGSMRATARRRRRVRRESDGDSSEEEMSAASVRVGVSTGPRSHRASKAAAMSKMMASQNEYIEEVEEEGMEESEEDEETSDLSAA